MKLIFLSAVAFVYLANRHARCEDKTLIWIQHPDIPDYYEHLLEERAKCKKAHTSNATKLFKRLASIGRSGRSSTKNSALESSSQRSVSEASTSPKLLRSNSANCRKTQAATNEKVMRRALSFSDRRSNRSYEQLPTEESYRLLRSSSSGSFDGKSPTSARSNGSNRGALASFLTDTNCSLHRSSLLKKLKTPYKQELCDANLVLFSLLEDGTSFPDPIDEATATSASQALELRARANWPLDNAANVHPILFRYLYNIHQNFLDNLPRKKTNKTGILAGSGKKKSKEKNVEGYVKVSTKTKKNYVKIVIQKRWETEKVKAIPCIVYENRSWFIIDGFAADQYFTVEKSSDEECYQVTGLLEPMAEIEKKYISLPVHRLERNFREMQQWIVRSKSRIDLCRLDDVLKFRLCNEVYAAWRQQQQKLPDLKWNLTRRCDSKACIDNVILKSRDKKTPWLSNIPVTLLPCTVNNDRPAFYITANEGGKSVFIVNSSRNNGDFFLSMSVTHLTVLASVQLHDLIVDYRSPHDRTE